MIGVYRAFSMTMASTAGSGTVDLTQSWDRVYLLVPSMVSAANLDIYVKATSGEGYFQLFNTIAATSTAQCTSFTIGVTGATNGKVVPLLSGMQYYKVVADSIPTGSLSFKFICGT